MPRSRRLLLLLVFLVSCIGCDQVTKTIAERTMADRPRISLLYDTVRLQHVENEGAFLGLGASLPEGPRFWLLTVLTGGVLLGLLGVLVTRSLSRSQFLGMTLIAAGGIGNLIDRVLQDGRVTDFLNVGIGPLRTGIFNVADVAIMAGALALILRGLLDGRDAEGSDQPST